jgi:hypothetical protein
VQPPIIPAPPAAQIPTNATSTDYTVDEARAKIESGSEPVNSALSSAPPPVVPGAETTPPASPSPRVAPAIPKSPPEGPNVRLFRSSSRVNAGELGIIDAEVFFPVMNDYPIGTVVPYTVTGQYVNGSTVPSSLITPSSTEGYAGRTAGYGLTPIPAGLPLDGTFRITGTRIGGFAISTSTSLADDAILTITVAGTTTYVVVMAQNPSLQGAVLDILSVSNQVLSNGQTTFGEITETLEVGKDFYVTVRPRPCTSYAEGSIVISSGPGFSVKSRPIDIAYGDSSSDERGSTFSVPGSLIPTPGPVMITFSCAIFGSGSFFGSKVMEVVPSSFPTAVGVLLNGWSSAAAAASIRIVAATRGGKSARLKEGTSIAIVVTGPPNSEFSWGGFDSSGISATDSNGICVFPNLIVPPAYTAPPDRFSGRSPRGNQEYSISAFFRDGTSDSFLIIAIPAG